MSKGKIDPIADAETVETELMLADLESLEKRIKPLEKKANSGEKEAKEQLALMMKARACCCAKASPPAAPNWRRRNARLTASSA